MDRIEMLDLHAEDQPLRNQINQAIALVISRGDFINGEDVRLFKEELESYLHTPYIIPCANGTDALQLCLMALDLPEGGEIITPAFSYAATVEAILHLGYKPVFVDVDPETYNINPALIEEAITERTCAILPVHLYGQCADMNAIMRIARVHNLKVVEDAAQAIGSGLEIEGTGWMAAGSVGDAGGFSFFPSKNLGCYGDGGAVITRQPELGEYIRSLANHGQSERYMHQYIGINSRLDTIQAAILRVKLTGLDEKIRRRQEIASRYDKGFSKNPFIITPVRKAGIDHVYHQYTLQANGIDRSELLSELNKNHISARIYYPTTLPLQPAYQNLYAYRGKDKAAQTPQDQFPVAYKLSETVFSIPVHPALTDDEVEYIIDSINNICSHR